MSTYLVSYDLSNKDNYDDLYTYLKSYGTYARITESLWAIVTSKTSSTIRNEILKMVDKSSRVLISKTCGNAAWSNIISRDEWLMKYI